MRIRKLGLVLLFFVLSLVFIGCNFSENLNTSLGKVRNAYITIDINPSIEIITNEDGLVEQVNALNDDAIKLLVDMDFKGQLLDGVLDSILVLAVELGYLDFTLDNAILITTGADTPKDAVELETKVSEKVQDFIDKRKLNIEVLKANLSASEDIKTIADEYNISIGKVKLITYAMAMDNTLTFEVAAQMSVRDLNHIVKMGRDEIRDFYSDEVRSEYYEMKKNGESTFKLAVIEIFNSQIQESDEAVFAELLEDSTTTVEEIKALYQEYYNALLEAKVPTEFPLEDDEPEDEVDEPEHEVDEEEDVIDVEELEAQIEELINQLRELEKQLQELMEEFKNATRNRDSNTDWKKIEEEIRELTQSKRELNRLINELIGSLNSKKDKNDRGKGHGQPGFGNKDIFPMPGRDLRDDWRHRNPHNNLEDLYSSIEKLYEEKFKELGIELKDLEGLFKNILEERIKLLEETMKENFEDAKEQMRIDSKAIKEQIKEENEILRKIWKK